MHYFSLDQIRESLRKLRPHHALFATTFFVMKKARVPVGEKIRFSLDAANRDFLHEHYRVHPKSEYFFRVFRQGSLKKDWLNPDYAGKGLQSVNTRGAPDAFVHDRNDNTWGWSKQYVRVLTRKLPQGKKIPLFDVAVWFGKYREWSDSYTRKQVVSEFLEEYLITASEAAALFDLGVQSKLTEQEAFQETPVHWAQILEGYSLPADVPVSRSAILQYIETEGVGPASTMVFRPGERLNIITGDNGLGKTFLLDLAWWALTNNWANQQAWPASILNVSTKATIKYSLSGDSSTRPTKSSFSTKTMQWITSSAPKSVSGLVIYARVDGSFAVWDPANKNLPSVEPGSVPVGRFGRDEVWNGRGSQIEGLIRDWVRWQERSDRYQGVFTTFTDVLRRMWPSELGEFKVGEPVRIPGDVRDIPALVHPYGKVPVTWESAGIRRVIALAYLIVWAWEEHKVQSRLAHEPEERQMVVILDEAEAHLHPRWQRVFIPALAGIGDSLSRELSVQFIIATHSPLVLASSESIFDPDVDKIYNLDLTASHRVELREVPYEARGTIDSWLASPLFGLHHPGSPQREAAIEAAVALQQAKEVSRAEVAKVHKQLSDSLPASDPFWVRWVFFAERHGIKP